MSVYLRKRKISKDRFTLYLDIYHKGKRYPYEYLNMYLLPKDTHNNKEKIIIAEAIRSKRELDLKNNEHGFLTARKTNADFFKVFQSFINSYSKTDVDKFKGCLKHLKYYSDKDNLPCSSLSKAFFEKFLDYMQVELAPETSSSYFKLLRRVIRYAIKEGFLKSDPSEGIINRNKDAGKLKKEYLLPDEMRQLIKADCPNTDVKRAFITAYYTGLRGTDVRTLKWKEVKLSEGIIDLDQNKTDHRVTIDLHKKVIEALGTPGKKNDLIFDFPRDRKALQKIMLKWVKNSELEKHITFHCARVSFATMLISNGVDLITVKELMGLRSLKMLEKYSHALRENKRKAILTLK